MPSPKQAQPKPLDPPFILSSLGINSSPDHEPPTSARPLQGHKYTINMMSNLNPELNSSMEETFTQLTPEQFSIITNKDLPQLTSQEMIRIHSLFVPGRDCLFPWKPISTLIDSKSEEDAEGSGLSVDELQSWRKFAADAVSEGWSLELWEESDDRDYRRRLFVAEALIWGLAVDLRWGVEGMADVVRSLGVEKVLVHCDSVYYEVTV